MVRVGITLTLLALAQASVVAATADVAVLQASNEQVPMSFQPKAVHGKAYEGLVRKIAKHNAKSVVKERAYEAAKLDAAEKEQAVAKVAAEETKPESLAKLKVSVNAEIKNQVAQKEAALDDAEAKKQVEAMVESAAKKHNSTKLLVKEQEQGVEETVEKEEEAAAEEVLRPKTAEDKAVEHQKEVAEAAKKTMEQETNIAADSVVQKLSSPIEKEAVKVAMKDVMKKAVDKAAQKVGDDIANHVVFHHHYHANGTVETKQEKPGDVAAIDKANLVAAEEIEKAQSMEAEKAKLAREMKAETEGPAKSLVMKSKEEKAQEAADIARETANEIEDKDNNPENDTPEKLSMIKAKAKIKVIHGEAESQTDTANEKVEKGKVAERFAKRMIKHSKEIAKKNARMVKESANKRARIAFLEAQNVKREAIRMENSAERQAERTERKADRGVAKQVNVEGSSKKAQAKPVTPVDKMVSGAKPASGPWGNVEASGGIHVHVRVEKTESGSSKQNRSQGKSSY